MMQRQKSTNHLAANLLTSHSSLSPSSSLPSVLSMASASASSSSGVCARSSSSLSSLPPPIIAAETTTARMRRSPLCQFLTNMRQVHRQPHQLLRLQFLFSFLSTFYLDGLLANFMDLISKCAVALSPYFEVIRELSKEDRRYHPVDASLPTLESTESMSRCTDSSSDSMSSCTDSSSDLSENELSLSSFESMEKNIHFSSSNDLIPNISNEVEPLSPSFLSIDHEDSEDDWGHFADLDDHHPPNRAFDHFLQDPFRSLEKRNKVNRQPFDIMERLAEEEEEDC